MYLTILYMVLNRDSPQFPQPDKPSVQVAVQDCIEPHATLTRAPKRSKVKLNPENDEAVIEQFKPNSSTCKPQKRTLKHARRHTSDSIQIETKQPKTFGRWLSRKSLFCKVEIVSHRRDQALVSGRSYVRSGERRQGRKLFQNPQILVDSAVL